MPPTVHHPPELPASIEGRDAVARIRAAEPRVDDERTGAVDDASRAAGRPHLKRDRPVGIFSKALGLRGIATCDHDLAKERRGTRSFRISPPSRRKPGSRRYTRAVVGRGPAQQETMSPVLLPVGNIAALENQSTSQVRVIALPNPPRACASC